jgi:hypothetical protein
VKHNQDSPLKSDSTAWMRLTFTMVERWIRQNFAGSSAELDAAQVLPQHVGSATHVQTYVVALGLDPVDLLGAHSSSSTASTVPIRPSAHAASPRISGSTSSTTGTSTRTGVGGASAERENGCARAESGAGAQEAAVASEIC